MSIKEWYFDIQLPKLDELRTARIRLLYPMLRLWLEEEELLPKTKGSRTVKVYASPYDTDSILTTAQHIGMLWQGFSPVTEKFASAQNDLTSFWFLPTLGALPSLFYLFGKENEEYVPRSQIMLSSPSDINRLFGAAHSFSDMQKSKELRETIAEDSSMVTVGIWLDYDGDGNYRNKVYAFLRLWHYIAAEVFKQMQFGETAALPIRFLLLANSDSPPPDTTDLNLVSSPLCSIEYEYDFFRFVNRSLVYLSFDKVATAYDPMSAVFDAKGVTIISPSRMDTLSQRTMHMPDSVFGLIEALISPGSPGVVALANNFVHSFEHLQDIFVRRLTEIKENK